MCVVVPPRNPIRDHNNRPIFQIRRFGTSSSRCMVIFVWLLLILLLLLLSSSHPDQTKRRYIVSVTEGFSVTVFQRPPPRSYHHPPPQRDPIVSQQRPQQRQDLKLYHHRNDDDDTTNPNITTTTTTIATDGTDPNPENDLDDDDDDDVYDNVISTTTTTTTLKSSSSSSSSSPQPEDKNLLDLLFHPYSSTIIPPEMASDIYIAEGNTIAAQKRTQRICLYAIIAFASIVFAFFNGFLTELRSHPPPTLPDGTSIQTIFGDSRNTDGSYSSSSLFVLDAFGFGWVHSNVVISFLLTNQMGGILCLLLGGATGLLAEAEYDTRRINAEQIYTELVQRRQQRQRQQNTATTVTRKRTTRSSSNSNSNSSGTSNKKAKRRSNSKEAKRLNALAEVTMVQGTNTPPSSSIVLETTVTNIKPNAATENETTTTTRPTNPGTDGTNNPNILDRVKRLYQQADSMAMTQALLLNQQLEEQGILPKITDETGLKVIPRPPPPITKESDVTKRNDITITTGDE